MLTGTLLLGVAISAATAADIASNTSHPPLALAIQQSLAAPTRLAQVDLGQILRQGRARLPRGAPSAGDCRELLDWMSILEKEVPGIDVRRTVMDRLYPMAANLFRDEHFEPFFGKPFSRTDPEERLEYYRRVMHGCGARQLGAAELSRFTILTTIFGRPFSSGKGSFSADDVTARLAAIQRAISWRESTEQNLDRAQFEELSAHLKRAQTELAMLWPRERRAFADRLTARQRVLARTVLEQAVASAAAQSPLGLQGARAIAALQASHAPHLQLLESDARVQIERGFGDAIAASLSTMAQAERPKLSAVPAGLDGAMAIGAWRAALTADLKAFPETPAVSDLLAEAARRQGVLLAEGLAEFRQIAAAHPRPVRNNLNASQLYDRLFGDAATSALPIAGEYRSLLDVRLSALRREEAAAAPAVTAARARCDELAAHPDDEENPAGVKGVIDAAITPARAIDACTEAIGNAPDSGRYHFQLGRAQWAAKRHGEAVESFLLAQELDYAPAYFYLAEAYDYGLVDGEKPDAAFATKLYGLAAEGGFLPAMAMLGYDTSVLDTAAFARPALMRALYAGDLKALNDEARIEILAYLASFQALLSMDPNEYDPSCPARTDLSLTSRIEREEESAAFALVRGAIFGGGTTVAGMQQKANAMAAIRQDGVDDAYLLVAEYGGCTGAAFNKVYATLRRFLGR